MASKLQPLRRLFGFFKPSSSSHSSFSAIRRSGESRFLPLEFYRNFDLAESTVSSSRLDFPGRFCYRVFSSKYDAPGPAPIDYSSLLQEDEFHRLANSTIHNLQEKFEEYGDMVQIDGFDVDYGNEVLTLKLGSLGTYVLNKQTPNRQIWLSSPVSGPSRFDWDRDSQAWVYRRTKANLFQLMETELENLCGQPLQLS